MTAPRSRSARRGAVEARLLNLTDAASAIGVSVSTLKRMLADGRLESVRVNGEHGTQGRRLIPTAAIDEYVEALRESERKAAAPRKRRSRAS